MYWKVTAHLVTRTHLALLLFLFIILGNSPAFTQAEQLGDKKNISSNKEKELTSEPVKTYLHPIRKFSVLIPVGAELIERKDLEQISIRSRRGYIINIQSGDANPSLLLIQMIAKLEKRYLGQGKPWSHKLSEKPTTKFGLDAIKAVYEGAGTRAMVIIARGLATDFVIIFFAPAESFEKLEPEFKRFLSNFRPDSIEISVARDKMTEHYQKLGRSIHLLPQFKLFTSSGHGFSIQYPEKWIVSKSFDNTIASFSSKNGRLGDRIVVSIQNVRPPAARTSSEVAELALAEFKSTLARDALDFRVIEEKSMTLNLGNLKFFGQQIIVTYSYLGNSYRRWSILLPRPDDTIAHIWSYTAPDKQFLNFRPLADTMLKSWIIQTGRS